MTDSGKNRQNRAMTEPEGLYAAANAGLWGDVALLVAAWEVLERDRHPPRAEPPRQIY